MIKSKPSTARPTTKTVTTKNAKTQRVAGSGSVSAKRSAEGKHVAPAGSVEKMSRPATAQSGVRSRPPVALVQPDTPTVVRFFLADDARQEVHGKMTMVGLYADNVVVAEMPSGHSNPSKKAPVAIPGISILASVSIALGEHRYRMEIDRSSVTPQTIEAKTTTLMSAQPGESVNLIMRLAPLVFIRFGMVHVLLHIDDEPYRFSFEIRRRDKVQ
jgi:hypothetical protein